MEYKSIDSDLTESQRTAVVEFRSVIKEKGLIREDDPNALETDDLTLLRFLKARSFNITKALQMYVDCLRWRQNLMGVGMDALYRRTDPWDYPERDEVFSKWPIWFHKTDKLGRPLNIQTFGSMDIPALHRVVTPDRHWETVLVNCESLTREVLPAASKKAGRPITSALCIVDLKGFGLSQFWGMKSLVRSSFQISQDYYPETMGRLLVINAPSSFTVIWTAVKPWLAKETVEKVDILGKDYQKVLLDVVGEENLPVMFGGKCVCGGEGGCEKGSEGPWMEERRKRGGETGHQEGEGVKSMMNGDAKALEGDGMPNGNGPDRGRSSPSSSSQLSNQQPEHKLAEERSADTA